MNMAPLNPALMSMPPMPRRMIPAMRTAIPMPGNPNRVRIWRQHPVAADPNPSNAVPFPFAVHPCVIGTGRGHDNFGLRRGWSGFYCRRRGGCIQRTCRVDHAIHHSIAYAGLVQVNYVRPAQTKSRMGILNLCDDDIVTDASLRQHLYIRRAEWLSLFDAGIGLGCLLTQVLALFLVH